MNFLRSIYKVASLTGLVCFGSTRGRGSGLKHSEAEIWVSEMWILNIKNPKYNDKKLKSQEKKDFMFYTDG